MILKDECKKRGFTVGRFLAFTPFPAQTLRDWCKSKPEQVNHLLDYFALSIRPVDKLVKSKPDLNVKSENQARVTLRLICDHVVASIYSRKKWDCLGGRAICVMPKASGFDDLARSDVLSVVNYLIESQYNSALPVNSIVDFVSRAWVDSFSPKG